MNATLPLSTTKEKQDTLFREISTNLEKVSAEERVRWGRERFRSEIILSTSFGAQSAVLLHMVTEQDPQVPVVMIDTGYLFPETYRFADELTERLKLNLKVYRAKTSPAWQEARHGKLWEEGVEGIERYNKMNKVEPMQRALRELGARAWITGLRRQQAKSRADLGVLRMQDGVMKIHPIIDWTDRMIFQYLTKHNLPYHPLWAQGYVSIGDVHTTRPLSADMTEEETRFFGLKRECGLHIGENI
jgi:phosphoadenosine phosphosulfate reductase